MQAKAEGSGLYIVAGSTEFGAARETPTNGVFTGALVEGLRGAADRENNGGNGDGKVDVAELIAYARAVVDKLDGPQRVTTPDIKGGDPFPLTRIR